MFASSFSAVIRAAVLLFLFVGTAHAERFTVDALGGTLDVFEIPGGALTSAEGEDKITFLKRACVVLQAYTRKTGFEACSKIWTQGERLAVRATTNRAHAGCITTNLAPAGDDWTRDADSIHSHPLRPAYRTNEADALFQGYMVPVGTRSHTDGTDFSPRDFALGRGYLVDSEGRLLYQRGRNEVEDLGPVESRPVP